MSTRRRALRGGKATLGIVTAVEIVLLALTEVHGGAVYFDGAHAPAVVHAWSRWAEDLPEHTTSSLALLQLPPLPSVPPPLAGRLTVAVCFASIADAQICEALLAPRRAVAPALIDTVGALPCTQLGTIHADPVEPLPGHEDSTLLRALPPEAVDALLTAAGPGSDSPQAVVELRHLGGALARPGTHASAFCHRDAAYSVQVIGVLAPEIAAAVAPHAAGVLAALEPWSTGGILPNFAPAPGAQRAARSYDEGQRTWLAGPSECDARAE